MLNKTLARRFLASVLILILILPLIACQKEEPPMTRIDSSLAAAITVENATVHEPSKGQSYTHHPYLAVYGGTFYAIYSCGFENEEDCGQWVMLSTSSDGLNWSEPAPLARPGDVGDENGVLTACGFYYADDGLIAYFSYYRYDPAAMNGTKRPTTDSAHLDTCLYAVKTTDGKTWSEPLSLGLAFTPNLSPFITVSGRLLFPGHTAYPYSDDPSGLGPFTMTGIYGDTFDGETVIDDSASIHRVKEARGWDNLLCEGSPIQLKNGTLKMLLRSQDGFLWCTDSTDNGLTWSEPYRTEFANDDSKFFFGKLPNGRYFYIGNPEPNGYRVPLCLYTSKDGLTYDRAYLIGDELYEQHFAGLYKGGIYGYPYAVADGDYLYIIYSLHKEKIEVARVALKDIP